IEDHPLVSFLPLDLTNPDSIETVLSNIDFTMQYGEDEEPKEVRALLLLPPTTNHLYLPSHVRTPKQVAVVRGSQPTVPVLFASHPVLSSAENTNANLIQSLHVPSLPYPFRRNPVASCMYPASRACACHLGTLPPSRHLLPKYAYAVRCVPICAMALIASSNASDIDCDGIQQHAASPIPHNINIKPISIQPRDLDEGDFADLE
ncbi:hypothetical protein EVG20_g10105, partial [Dentipellis fragilis]